MAFKFNNGRGAIICDYECSAIIREDITKDQVPNGQHVCPACAVKLRKKLKISKLKAT